MYNRLAEEISPYLRQHAGNPVQWQPWDRDALRLAAEDRKPIFLSIGYAACHWCHVMEEESFQNPRVAELLNSYFIPIKVDREERPDLDELFMRSTMIFSRGQGGWPMTVFLTPDQKPFFAGTYFPPEDRYGRPGLVRLLRHIAELWSERREDLQRDAGHFAELTAGSLTAAWEEYGAVPEPNELEPAVAAIREDLDASFGTAADGGNRFPPYQALDLLIREYLYQPDRRTPTRFEGILEQMAEGGIFDHLGGGLFRYSTDPYWHVPHFEKMLYDQALAARRYLEAFQATRRPLFAETAGAIFNYVLRELRDPKGGFFSSQDADSEGLEGKYYLWTLQEIRETLGEADGQLVAAVYEVTETGNWQAPEDRHIPPGPKNVLHRVRSLQEVAKQCGISVALLQQRLPALREHLLQKRRERIPPAKDEKILTDWNGLMITSLVLGGRLLSSADYVEAGASVARYLLSQRTAKGNLVHVRQKGTAAAVSFITDYAFLIEALLCLFQAEGHPGWLREAENLTDDCIRQFWDDNQGGFYLTSAEQEPLFCRWKSTEDHVLPCANAVMAEILPAMAGLLHRPDLRDKAQVILCRLGKKAILHPGAYTSTLSACLRWRREIESTTPNHSLSS
jgi:uncharacterized protein